MENESLQKMAMEQEPEMENEAEDLEEQEEQDLQIAVDMGMEMIDDGGFDMIQQAIDQSNDPGQVIGQFLLQLGSEIMSKMPEGLELSPRILLAHDGWVEQISDYLQDQYGVSEDIMNRAESYVGAAAMQMAQGGAQQAPGGPPPQAPAQGLAAAAGGMA